jgi:hypothetical protein
MAGSVDPRQLLDVDMDELAGMAALVAVGRLGSSSRLSLPSPMRRSTTDTVESGIRSAWLISAAVNRSRRRIAIASTRSPLVAWGERQGRDERSTSPASPSARKRATHFDAVRALTPTASAAAVNPHPCSSTRATNNRRLRGHVRALACSFIRASQARGL